MRVTTANVGSSGLPIGQIACASTLTNPTNRCQPLDVFGDDVASPAALQYINGPARSGQDAEVEILNQDVAAASLQGQLPWGLPAGRVAIAMGGEYRKEAASVTATALAEANAFPNGNFKNFAGQYQVEEGFLEVNAPILKNVVVQSLDFNAAGRVTNYSTSGAVETWKLGLTSQVNDDIRLRTSWSFDIRAPDLSELFSPSTPGEILRSIHIRAKPFKSFLTQLTRTSSLSNRLPLQVTFFYASLGRWIDRFSGLVLDQHQQGNREFLSKCH